MCKQRLGSLQQGPGHMQALVPRLPVCLLHRGCLQAAQARTLQLQPGLPQGKAPRQLKLLL